MRSSLVSVAVATMMALVGNTHAKYVFAHYMLGTTTTDHIHQDIDDAMAMGIDGFALNMASPTADFVSTAMSDMFGYANYVDFKLYISMDLYAYGDSCYKANIVCNGPFDYYDILAGYLGHPAWFRDTPNGFPLISTFSSGGYQWGNFNEWRNTFANEMYFIPDIDETLGYYESSDAWWYYWGNITEGVFSWESAWPVSSTRPGYGGIYAGDVSPDVPVVAQAKSRGKGYMMGLSTLQYKDSYGANVYRGGELNLPKRMEAILNMKNQPDYIQIITWNDFPESHNIGNVWPEQNTDTQPLNYGNADDWPHQAWQGIHTSFIKTWKAGGNTADMRPVNSNNKVEGAMWYRTILQDAVCPNDGLGDKYYAKPDNFDTGIDQISYAIVVAAGVTDLYARCTSEGIQVAPDRKLYPGLNYGFCEDITVGTQRLLIVDGSGDVQYAANGVACIELGCPQGIYNMNYQVAALGPETDMACKTYSTGHFTGGVFVGHDYDPTAAWREVTCDVPALTHVYNDGTEQWTAAMAEEAWNDAVASWKYRPAGSTVTFANWVGDYFHARPNMNCDWLDNPNCDVTINCGQDDPNAAVNSPAGYLILNGFIGVHTGFDSFYDALGDAQKTLDSKIGSFSSTFAPVWDEEKSLKLALDILGMVWGVFAAPLWNSWLKSASVFENNANALGITKDTVNSLISNSITIAKDASDVGLSTLEQQNSLSAFLGGTVQAWVAMIQTQLTDLFNGSDVSNTQLYSLIENCQTFNTQNTTSEQALEPTVEKALWAYMIPIAWAESTENVVPFIANGDGVPQSSDKDGCEGWNPTKASGTSEHLNSDDGSQNFVCGAGTGYAPYWLTNIIDKRVVGCNPIRSDCGLVTFGTLPGISTLGGSGLEGSWGGLTRDDLVVSALTSWNNNHQKNGWAAADPTDSNTISDLYDNGLNAPGFVNIPICSFEEAMNNVLAKTKTDNYPCN